MDIQPTTQQQPISDDQELSKALAGVTPQAENDLQFESAPPPTTSDSSTMTDTSTTPDVSVPEPEPVMPPTVPEPEPAPEPTLNPVPTPSVANSNLEAIKKDALVELRPLVDKLNISPEEKFDTYLLLIRSTDDTALIAPAHAAAAAITDETRRAQALLDIIKEIDYLSNPQQGTQLK
jgi:hypothetical protein